MRKKKQLDIATKGLREMIIKQNTRDFRKEQEDKAARRSKEYGKVLFEVRRFSGVTNFSRMCDKVAPRDRNDQIRRLEQRRTKENMERRRKNSERIHRWVVTKLNLVNYLVCNDIFLDFMPPRMRRWTLTVMRRRTRF